MYGLSAAVIEQDKIVLYRGKYYLVNNEAPRLKRGKPLCHTESSLPAPWRKALAGEGTAASPTVAAAHGTPPSTPKTENPPNHTTVPPITSTQSITDSKEKVMFSEDVTTAVPATAPPYYNAPPVQAGGAADRTSEATKSAEPPPKKSNSQAKKRRITDHAQGVDVTCPYCSHKERMPEERATGKSGIHACKSCHAEFGLRITAQVTYKVEVAAFAEKG